MLVVHDVDAPRRTSASSSATFAASTCGVCGDTPRELDRHALFHEGLSQQFPAAFAVHDQTRQPLATAIAVAEQGFARKPASGNDVGATRRRQGLLRLSARSLRCASARPW